jgi:hypothetical protein
MPVKDLRSRYPIAVAWPRSAYDLNLIDSISFHHSVTSNLSPNASEAEEIRILDAFHAYHKSLGFGGIGYHLCVFPSGRVYLTCSLTQWGANVGGHNNHEIGICFVGTWTNTLPGKQQQVGAAIATDSVDQLLRRKVRLLGHKQYSGHASNACPGRVLEILPNLRSLIPATGVWAEVTPVSKRLALQRNTPLVNLQTGAKIKDLPKGAMMDIGAQYRNTHYLTVYSYSNRIPNGFLISSTVPTPPPPPPPPPPPDPIYAEVTPHNANVTLYKDTPLVNLATGATVKMLPRGTKLEVSCKYRNTHFITTYSCSRKIPNGFAISATVPPVEDCTTYKQRITILEGSLAAKKQQIASMGKQIDTLSVQLAQTRNALRVSEEIVNKVKAAHEVIG